jgi:hypothetical protein
VGDGLLRYLTDRTLIGDDESCWPWLLSAGSHGYGQGYWQGRQELAHVLWWEVYHGSVPNRGRDPEQNTLDHVCHNRECVNPYHLRILVNRENARDNGYATRTHCPQGHEYTPENTRHIKTVRPGRGPARQCIACQNAYNASR